MTIAQAALEVGVKRTSMYYYVNVLGIETKRFKLSREKYISATDVKRIKEIRQKPWLAGEKPGVEEDASRPRVRDALAAC